VLSVVLETLAAAGLTFLVFASVWPLSPTTLDVAIGLFLTAAVLWSVVQLRRGRPLGTIAQLTTRQRIVELWLPAGLGVLLVLGGAALLALYYSHTDTRDGFTEIGAVLVYVGLGEQLMVVRRLWRGLLSTAVVLLSGVALAVGAAMWLLAGADVQVRPYLYWVLGLCVLVVIPVGLNVVSEAAIRSLARSRFDGVGRSRAWYLGGVVFVVLAFVGTAIGSHSWRAVLFVTFGALVLIAAIASNTRLDIAIVVSAIALIAAAPAELPVPPVLTPGQGSAALVALGDSYLSGEGADTFYRGTDDGGGDECRRAPSAYPAAEVTSAGSPFDALTFLACSGAETAQVISRNDDPGAAPQRGTGPLTQVDRLAGYLAANPSFHPKLVIVSIGGNDAGFATLGETCLAPGDCADISHLFEDNLPAVGAALRATYASVREVVPDVPVVAVPYPEPIDATQPTCPDLPLTWPERQFVARFVGELDLTVQQAAAAEGVYYLDTMESALATGHRQLCQPGNEGHLGINSVRLDSVSGLAAERYNPAKWVHDSLHPNAWGQQAMLAAFRSWLAAHPTLPVSASVAPPRAAGLATAPQSVDPPCTFTAADGCRAQASSWIDRQFLEWTPLLFPFLIGLAGLWMMSVVGLAEIAYRVTARAAFRPANTRGRQA